MTDLVMTYTVNPISSFFKSFSKTFIYAMELRGMVRAAQELDRMGYKKEAQDIMERARNYQKF